MTLHILNKANSHTDVNSQLSNVIEQGDEVVLIENGVLQCLTPSSDPLHWSNLAGCIHVLKDDAVARGIAIAGRFSEIDYATFVKLSVEHSKVLSWY